MSDQTTARAFESYGEEILLQHGDWSTASNAEWGKERALCPAQIFGFTQDTQPKLWEEIQALHQSGLDYQLRWANKKPNQVWFGRGVNCLNAEKHAQSQGSVASRMMSGIQGSSSSDIFRQYGQMPR